MTYIEIGTPELEALEEEKHLKCRHCGITSENVVMMGGYTGGRGYHLQAYCQDAEACWKRYDKEVT